MVAVCRQAAYLRNSCLVIKQLLIAMTSTNDSFALYQALVISVVVPMMVCDQV